MIGPWTGMAMVLAAMGILIGLLKLMERLLHPHPEILRKLMHVFMGLIVLSFPWVFPRPWPVLLLSAISVVIMVAIKRVARLHDGIGSILTRVDRASFGEVCFPIAVGTLFYFSYGDSLLYVVPMLILTLADTVAALIGIVYGKVRYVTSEGLKSAEGSIAFFAIAFLSVHVPLLLFTNLGRRETLLVAVIIGMLSMLIEAIAWRGLDNLLIPVGAFAFLKLYLHASQSALLLRLYVTIALLILALVWRRRTSLDDSALMACALFGYGAGMLGGWPWLIGPAVLFLIHVSLWPRSGPRRVHSVHAVFSVTLAGLFWLGLHAGKGGGRAFVFPYAVAFGVHLALMIISRIAVDPSSRSKALRVMAAIFAGFTLIGLQMIPVLAGAGGHAHFKAFASLLLTSFACVALGAIAFFFLLPVLYGERGSNRDIYITGSAIALLASALAAGIQLPAPAY